jgi:hypothetical protein
MHPGYIGGTIKALIYDTDKKPGKLDSDTKRQINEKSIGKG